MNRDVKISLEIWLTKQLSDCEKRGQALEMLTAMAEVLQQQLTCRSAIPHNDSLELIMRAVTGTLQNDPSLKDYILSKLNIGYHDLTDSLNESQFEL